MRAWCPSAKDTLEQIRSSCEDTCTPLQSAAELSSDSSASAKVGRRGRPRSAPVR